MNLVLAFVALTCLAAPPRVAPADNPLKAPIGWKSETKDGATTFTPADVATGKLYVVVVTMLEGKAGSMDEILATGRALAGEIGTFKSAIEPRQDKSDGGWDYKFDL